LIVRGSRQKEGGMREIINIKKLTVTAFSTEEKKGLTVGCSRWGPGREDEGGKKISAIQAIQNIVQKAGVIRVDAHQGEAYMVPWRRTGGQERPKKRKRKTTPNETAVVSTS